MATFKVETKNKLDIDKKPRVYFTCHPDDFERYFKKVCDDIFKTHDCAIYYTEDMTEIIAEDEKETDLGRNNLFVIPVTFRLLSTPNRAMDEDIPYALKEHIPVLPIMMEPGIDEFYSKPDKFGELQYLNPYSADLTEISYEEKLKKYLESVLISDELAKRVRAAFDAYIFLSYRKKDRKYANELMRLIHNNPECRDIAIWFDEFLTPGESFKENIEKILDDCKLFTLLVTPQLLEKIIDKNGEEQDNYVLSTELPLARKKKQEKGTDIFAVEMEKTNRVALVAIGIDSVINFEDASFQTQLLQTTSAITTVRNKTPEHNYLIGLAYLNGIDVEVDREYGLMLISSAAQAEFIPAMYTLQQIYEKGIAAKIDCQKSLKIAENIVVHCMECDGNEHPKTYKAKGALAESHNLCGLTCFVSEQYEPAKFHFFSSIQIYEELSKNNYQNYKAYLGIVYHNSAMCHYKLSDISTAQNHIKKAIDILEELSRKESTRINTDLANCYIDALIISEKSDIYHKKALCLKAIKICKVYPGDPVALTLLYDAYSKMGDLHGLEYYTEAIRYYLRALATINILAEYNPKRYKYRLFECYEHLSEFYEQADQFQLAVSYYQKGVIAFAEFKDDSEEDKVFLMESYIKAALLYVSINHTTEAKIHFFEAINLGKSLSDNHSQIYGHSMLMCYNELAVIYNSCDDTQNAEIYFLEAIEINETFAKLYPEEFAPELIVSYNNIIIFYREHNKMEKATPYYPKILKLLNL